LAELHDDRFERRAGRRRACIGDDGLTRRGERFPVKSIVCSSAAPRVRSGADFNRGLLPSGALVTSRPGLINGAQADIPEPADAFHT
jgi:hypothetical protein